MEDSEQLYVYTRTLGEEKLLVVCNFVEYEVPYTIPAEFTGAECMISNMENAYGEAEIYLRPYEAFVLKITGGN